MPQGVLSLGGNSRVGETLEFLQCVCVCLFVCCIADFHIPARFGVRGDVGSVGWPKGSQEEDTAEGHGMAAVELDWSFCCLFFPLKLQ